MRSLLVVVTQVPGDAGAARDAIVRGVQIDVIVFERSPQALDEHVVNGSAHSVHRDLDSGVLQDRGEVLARELKSLIRVEDFGRAVKGEGFVQGRDAEVTRHGVGQPPREDLSRVPVHDRDQVPESFLKGDVGDVGRPHVVRVIDHEAPEQIGIDRVGLVRHRRLWLR